MSSDPMKNDYLEEVQRKQERIEGELKVQKRGLAQNQMMPQQAMQAADAAPAARRARFPGGAVPPLPQADALSAAVDVRITGFWRWKTVLVPPNAYVVHTRKNVTAPLHLGLGVSFPYNPYSDSFLVVPGAMQTILINAHCICRELQGLLVQGYVQWIVADFATAYKKLDFSDAVDPMKVVNVQLREQAEAAIKDKVATMGIDEVLSDKQPIIQELTARLRAVAEGHGDSDKGLGLRIVTVQIKEAVVASARLWENLQKPFRADRERVARLAELNAQQVIQGRELEHRQAQQTALLSSDAEVAKLRSETEGATFDREQGERARRDAKAQEVARQVALDQHRTVLQTAELETARIQAEAAVERLRQIEALAVEQRAAQAKLALEDAEVQARHRHTEGDIAHQAARQKIENDLTPNQLQAKLIAALPEVAEKLPKPTELRSVSIDGGGSSAGALTALVAQIVAAVKGVQEPAKPA